MTKSFFTKKFDYKSDSSSSDSSSDDSSSSSSEEEVKSSKKQVVKKQVKIAEPPPQVKTIPTPKKELKKVIPPPDESSSESECEEEEAQPVKQETTKKRTIPLKYQCEKCNEKFSIKRKYIAHLKTHGDFKIPTGIDIEFVEKQLIKLQNNLDKEWSFLLSQVDSFKTKNDCKVAFQNVEKLLKLHRHIISNDEYEHLTSMVNSTKYEILHNLKS